MKKILDNKALLIGLTLIVGVTIGLALSPSANELGESRTHSEDEHNLTLDENGIWTCSMHPQIRQNEFGSCPICGMDLIPVEEESSGANPLAINMSPNAMKLANVQTEHIGLITAEKSIRMTGKVQEDERLTFTQSSHISGRIEALAVNYTGELVKKGQVLARVYSPSLVTAQQELFEVQKIKEKQPELFEAAKKKLLNWKLTTRQIDQIIAKGSPIETLPIISEQTGYVIEKMVNQGDYIQQGTVIYKITDLSKVWVLFDVYEGDLQWVNKGDTISFTISSLSGETFSGKINYIDPIIDSKSRVAKVRLEINNSDHRLKPEMFAKGTLKAGIQSKQALTIPKSAVMWTGTRSIVYVKNVMDTGTSFLMQEVTLGPALGDRYIVEEGLTAGQDIAVSGTFSIDAAAQLAGKPSMMNRQPINSNSETQMVGNRHPSMQMNQSESEMTEMSAGANLEVNTSEETYEVNREFQNQIKKIYQSYLPVKDAMIASDVNLTRKKANALQEAIENVDMSLLKGDARMTWMKDLAVLSYSTEIIIKENDIKTIRLMLSPLSDQLYHTLKKFQVETNGFRQFCPMAMNNQGAFWLSDSDKVLNPYFGDAMLTCGSVEEEI